MTFFNFYLICFLVGLVYAVVMGLLSGFVGGGGDHDFGMDGHVDAAAGGLDHGALHFSPLSPAVLATFLATFGGMGMISIEVFKVGPAFSILISLFVAIGIAFLVFLGFDFIFSHTQASTNVSASDFLDKEADVTTPIPENGYGEIVVVNGLARMNLPARSVDGKPINKHETVIVTKMLGNSVLVRRSTDAEKAAPQTPKLDEVEKDQTRDSI
ncbi:MAG: NfeD family protein [bacterium]